MNEDPKDKKVADESSHSNDDKPYDGKPVSWGDPIPEGYRWVDDPGGSDASAGYLEANDDDEYVDLSRYGW